MNLIEMIQQRLSLILVKTNPAVGYSAENKAKLERASELIRQVAADMYK